MQKMISSILLLWMLASFPSCYNEQSDRIKEINSFNEVNFKFIEQNTLVVFDVDETLIRPIDAYLLNEQSKHAESFWKKLLQKYPAITDLEWNDIASIMIKEAERPLIEPDIIQKINELKQRGITVIACTGMNTGTYGKISSMEQWRYEHLKSLGFEGSFNDRIIKFDTFESNPIFYKGILATDRETKGPPLGAFLDELQLHPKNIIMFDDSLDYLISVQEECKKTGIAFQGYLYKKKNIEKPWNEKLFEFQADYLIRNKKWLSDQDAQSFLVDAR